MDLEQCLEKIQRMQRSELIACCEKFRDYVVQFTVRVSKLKEPTYEINKELELLQKIQTHLEYAAYSFDETDLLMMHLGVKSLKEPL